MFSRLSVPTPFQVGPVNAYIAGRTLVDPGPESEEAWSKLLEALEERELTPADIERVVVTHPHPDHFGIARRFRDAGASVLASPEAADIMGDFPGRYEYEQSFFVDFFEQCGMARETAETVTQLPESYLRYAPSVQTDRELEAGDAITIRETALDVHEVQGHAAGELVFAFEADGEDRAIVGDNVLVDITPNPFLLPPSEPGGERPRVLPAYNDSLSWLQSLSFDHFLTGHREPVSNPAERIDEMLAAHEERTKNVLALLDGPMTPVDVMEGLFGDLPITEFFSGMSEAVGHLDVLEARNEVSVKEGGGMRVYERVE
jgi:glyoxylase-like metal-dependent hydrolase (beta-lactamase superfamily II)